MSGSRHRLSVAIAATAIAGVVVLVPTGLVQAHAIVDDVVPADGSALIDQPTQVVFTFSEPILAEGIGVEVATGGGSPTPSASAGIDPDDPTRVVVALGDMSRGTYQVRVRVRDLEDLHEVVARTSFAVGEAAPEPSPPIVDTAEPMEALARWLFAGGVALLFGVVAVRSSRRNIPLARPQRLGRLVLAGTLLVVLGRVGILLARTFSLGGSLIDDALTVARTSDSQRVVLVAIALGCVVISEMSTRALWLDVPVRVGRALTVRQALGWTGVVNLAVLAAWGGHSALEGPIEPLTVLAKSAHLLGIGLWVGVLAVAVVVNVGSSQLKTSLSATSGIAVTGAFITVVSGLLLTSRLVVSLTALAATPYGRMLSIKVILVLVVVMLGLMLRRSSHRRWPIAELGVMFVVVLLGAAIATATPALDTGFTEHDDTAVPVSPSLAVDDLIVQARAIPARPGVNTIELRIGETRRPSPGPVTDIEVSVGGDRYLSRPNADGVAYVEGVTLPDGESHVDARLRRRGTEDAPAALVVSTRPAVYVHPAFISSARIGRALVGLASVVAMLGIALWARRRGLAAGHTRPRCLGVMGQLSTSSAQRYQATRHTNAEATSSSSEQCRPARASNRPVGRHRRSRTG